MMLSRISRAFGATRGQTLIEFTLLLPFVIALGLAVIEFANIINNYLVLTHLTREASNLVSREPGLRGSSPWAARVDADLNRVINTSSSVIKSGNRADWRLTYSMIVWDGAANCGFLSNGTTIDRYVVERGSNTPGWVNPVWTYGSLAVPNNSNIGADGVCASVALPSVKSLPQGETLHVIESFYDYTSNRLTPVGNFIGPVVPGMFYTRAVFTDIPF
jgi:hypothetical protein